MASIAQRSNRYNVVYLYDDEATGKRKQKWESISLSNGMPEAGYSRTWAFKICSPKQEKCINGSAPSRENAIDIKQKETAGLGPP